MVERDYELDRNAHFDQLLRCANAADKLLKEVLNASAESMKFDVTREATETLATAGQHLAAAAKLLCTVRAGWRLR